jgi:riboflavin kinase/FMN adenylyltransferase
LQENGVEHVLVLNTSPALLQLSAREFFERIVVGQLHARSLVEGFNFGFGKNRAGTIDVLKQLCAENDVALTLMPPKEILGAAVSSSRVRAELSAGRVDVVAQLLGRTYRITGSVGTGAKRGATLGFPTANLHVVATLIPGYGVYAVQATIAPLAGSTATWPAAANVGPNPTFGENARKVEVHLIGFAGDLYGQSMCVDFIKKIRDTRPFGNADELVRQIGEDIKNVKMILHESV